MKSHLLLLLCLCCALGLGGCLQNTRRDSEIALSPKSQVKLATYRYLLEQSPATSYSLRVPDAVLVEAGPIEFRLLKNSFTNLAPRLLLAGVYPQNIAPEDVYPRLVSSDLKIKGTNAIAWAGWEAQSGSAVMYEFHLEKVEAWTIKHVSPALFMDR